MGKVKVPRAFGPTNSRDSVELAFVSNRSSWLDI